MIPIFFAMFLTALVETCLLWCFKYRSKKLLFFYFVLNLISNFVANISYQKLWGIIPQGWLIFILETGVLFFEIVLFGLTIGYNKKLYYSVFLTNLISFLLGILLFGL